MCVCLVGLGANCSAPFLDSNYNVSRVSEFALLSSPLEVPFSIARSSELRPPIPINEKYHLQKHLPQTPNLAINGMQEHMLHHDFALLFENHPPATFFEERFSQDYRMLESKEF